MELIYLFAGILTGFLIAFLFFRSRADAGAVPLEKYNELDRRHSVLEERSRLHEEEILRLREELLRQKNDTERQVEEERERMSLEHRAEKEKIERELQAERARAGELDVRINRSAEKFRAQEQRLNEQKEELARLQEQLTTQFENIAGKLLEEKTRKFTELNKTNLDIILNPFKEKLGEFEKKVSESYDKEMRDKISLREEVRKLYELNTRISEEATNLTRALKGDAKKQGNWGEVILLRVLERSGLIEGENYIVQGKDMKLRDEEGNLFQPDVIVHLPEQKHIIIDAKVSLVAYERMVGAEADEDRGAFLKQHIQSVRDHVKGLSSKDYSNLYGINSPDFVLLFIPIESCFSIAVQNDAELFGFAWDKKVVIVSPSTLLATLRTIASIWKQEKQTRNALEIASRAGALYDKFAGFVDDLEKVGKNLGLTQKAYDDAFGKLQRGRGNILNRVEDLRKLGAKASKQLDSRYLDDEGTELPE